MRKRFRGKGIPLHLLRILTAQIFLSGICWGATTPGAPAPLTLDAAIHKAYADNRTIQQRRLTFETSKLNYFDAWDLMFLPSVNLQLKSTSDFTMGRLPFGTTPASQAGDASAAHGFPAGAISLNLGQYTLFNFWRDQIVYEQAKLNYERERERVGEVERQVRFQIITEYFRLKTEQEKLEAARRSVAISESIVNLVKSRVRIGKATESDVSSSNVDLLTAKSLFNDQERTVTTEQRNLNILLGDPVDSRYLLKSELQYVHLSIGYDDALKIYFDNSPSIKDQRLALKVGDYGLELAEKQRLPLPTVTVSGIPSTLEKVAFSTTYYPNVNLTRFASFMKIAYQKDGVTIYQVK